METVTWTVFAWAMALIFVVFGIMWNYIITKSKDQNDKIEDQNKEIRELKLKIAALETCYGDVRVVMAKIDERMKAFGDTLLEIKDTINLWPRPKKSK